MLIVDRFEGAFAVCEDEKANPTRIGLDLLPENVSEGDVLVQCEGRYQIDTSATAGRKAHLREKMNRLKRRQGK